MPASGPLHAAGPPCTAAKQPKAVLLCAACKPLPGVLPISCGGLAYGRALSKLADKCTEVAAAMLDKVTLAA